MIYPQIHLHIPVMLFCPHLNHLHCTNSFCSNIPLFQLQDIIPWLSPLWFLLDLLSLGFSPPAWSCSLHSPCCIMVPTVPTWIADTLLVCPPVCLTSPPGHLTSILKGTQVELLMPTSLSSLSKSVPPQLCKWFHPTSRLTWWLHII